MSTNEEGPNVNQHTSTKTTILRHLRYSREYLTEGNIVLARYWLGVARGRIAAAPASTRRRWKSGR